DLEVPGLEIRRPGRLPGRSMEEHRPPTGRPDAALTVGDESHRPPRQIREIELEEALVEEAVQAVGRTEPDVAFTVDELRLDVQVDAEVLDLAQAVAREEQ